MLQLRTSNTLKRHGAGFRPTLFGAALAMLLALSPPPASAARGYDAPEITPTALAFAYDRLTGITPDFRAYAERTKAYLNASAFDRDTIRAREAERLAASFQHLDMDQLFRVNLSVTIQQYDSARGGFPLSVSATSYIPFFDPAAMINFGLIFPNADQVNLLGFPDEAAARAFSEHHRFEPRYTIAANGTLELVFKIVAAPPVADGAFSGITPLRAQIVSARLIDDQHQLLRDFGTVTAPDSITASTGMPHLAAVDLRGVKIGMSVDAAKQAAAKSFPTRQELGNEIDYFEALENTGRPPMPCVAEPSRGGGRMMGLLAGWKSCLSLTIAEGQVRHIEARQYLGTVEPDHLRQALIGKWGTPTSDHGSLLQWIGSDGTSPLVVKINATISVDDRGTTVLGVDIAPMPAARKPAAPAGIAPQL